jgi:transcriptional regulator with XRE-family HTH domain
MKGKMKYKFGHKLRAVRERKGYTLKDVAARATVSESLISQIERNKVSPSIDTLLLIADILDIDYEYLFSDYRQKRKVSIIRKNERGTIRRDGVAFHQLYYLYSGLSFAYAWLELGAGSLKERRLKRPQE